MLYKLENNKDQTIAWAKDIKTAKKLAQELANERQTAIYLSTKKALYEYIPEEKNEKK